jgi:Ion transport protein
MLSRYLCLGIYVNASCVFVECSEAHPCEGLGKHAHFRNFGMAFLTLFRVATGDNWNGIMKVRTLLGHERPRLSELLREMSNELNVFNTPMSSNIYLQ